MSQTLDYENLDLLKSVIGDDLKDILASFLTITPPLIEKIETAISENNAPDLQHHAHTLKGSAANIGGNTVSEISFELETMGRNASLGDASQTYEKLQQAYPELKKAVEDYIAAF